MSNEKRNKNDVNEEKTERRRERLNSTRKQKGSEMFIFR